MNDNSKEIHEVAMTKKNCEPFDFAKNIAHKKTEFEILFLLINLVNKYLLLCMYNGQFFCFYFLFVKDDKRDLNNG